MSIYVNWSHNQGLHLKQNSQKLFCCQTNPYGKICVQKSNYIDDVDKAADLFARLAFKRWLTMAEVCQRPWSLCENLGATESLGQAEAAGCCWCVVTLDYDVMGFDITGGVVQKILILTANRWESPICEVICKQMFHPPCVQTCLYWMQTINHYMYQVCTFLAIVSRMFHRSSCNRCKVWWSHL